MPHKLINLNPDLKQLFDEGYEIEIKNGYLLVHQIPYLDNQINIKRGTLVSTLNYSANDLKPPETHVIDFIGEFPCNKDGTRINGIEHVGGKDLGYGIKTNYGFSNKPKLGYRNYYEKIIQYIKIISAPAKSIDRSVSEKTHRFIEDIDQDSVFNYPDTCSSIAEINAITMKLSNQKIAIIGLGGTGSYILDLVSKTPVKEIHLFDGDIFLQHNAFRTPGAPSIEQLKEGMKKTDYLKNIYSKMHRKLISHSEYITESNILELKDMNFIFVSIDKSEIKNMLIDFFESNNIQFIDVGMGIRKDNESLTGILRITSSTINCRDHFRKRVSRANGNENLYQRNIQIADLNCLNAALAVIKWKKISGFYLDFKKENNTLFEIDSNLLINEDIDS